MLSVVAPIFNEHEGLREFHQRLTATLRPLGEYEIVVVDDGSTDGSWEQLITLSVDDPRLKVVRLSRNFGHQAALSAGLDTALGDAVVLMDADLQDPPEVIPRLVAKWREGFDVVYAVRRTREGERAWRRLAIRAFYRLLRRIAATDIPEDTGDFRLLSRRAVNALAEMPERARYLRGMTSWIGFRQIGITYERSPRFAGESKYPVGKLVRLATDGITSFSIAPIKAVVMLGFTMIVFCMGVLAWSLYERATGDHVPQGWTSVIAVVLLLGGVQLLSLGVLGQYVARIFEETKQRPLYLIDETLQRPLEPPPVAKTESSLTP
jgi:glycosyltransferase involved in cell wall biosynthesis